MATRGMSVFTHQGTDYTINDPNNADEFSTGTAYEVGDYVTYQGNLCRFKAAHSAGAWNAGHVDIVKMGARMKGAESKIDDINVEIGSTELPTTAQTITGAIAEMVGKMFVRNNETITDLDDISSDGWFLCGYGTEYGHDPIGVNNDRMVLTYTEQTGTQYRVQMIFSSSNAKIYFRVKKGNPASWSNWKICYGMDTLFVRNNETITDLDDISSDGWFLCGYATEYANDPIGVNKDRFVLTFTEQTGSAYRIQLAISESNGLFYGRVKKGNPAVWSVWVPIAGGGAERTIPHSFTRSAQASQGENTGTKLRVMTYNICQFNNDTSTYISDAKLLNLKKVLYEANADVLLIQEDKPYIDSATSKASTSYVYYPVYPNLVGGTGPSIHSKMTTDAGGIVGYTNGRNARYCVLEMGDIKLLLVSTHPVANQDNTGVTSAESIAARAVQYEQLFKWVNGEITLNAYGTSTPVTVPEHTHCIIGIDANSITDDDKANILSDAAGAGFVAGNGGAIGWFITEMRVGYAIDNVFVSDNIIINNIEAYNDWFKNLYSDHVPVVADLTLL